MFKANKEQALFLNNLAELFDKNAEDDEQYLRILLWANTYIAKELAQYENIYEELGW